MSEPATTFGDLAHLVRAKNAGPFWVTLDVFLTDEAAYRRTTEERLITPEVIARLYAVPAETVQVFELPSLRAVKASFPRAVSQGGMRDRDMHAGQQHVPLATMPLA